MIRPDILASLFEATNPAKKEKAEIWWIFENGKKNISDFTLLTKSQRMRRRKKSVHHRKCYDWRSVLRETHLSSADERDLRTNRQNGRRERQRLSIILTSLVLKTQSGTEAQLVAFVPDRPCWHKGLKNLRKNLMWREKELSFFRCYFMHEILYWLEI